MHTRYDKTRLIVKVEMILLTNAVNDYRQYVSAMFELSPDIEERRRTKESTLNTYKCQINISSYSFLKGS